MYFLSYHVAPTLRHPQAQAMRPSVVYCWVRADSQDEAEQIAKRALGQRCWDVLRLDSASELDQVDLEINPETAHRAIQAGATGFHCEFHEKSRGRRNRRPNRKLPRLLIGTLMGSMVGIIATLLLLDHETTRPYSPLGFVVGITIGLVVGFLMDLAHQRRENDATALLTASQKVTEL